MIKQRKVIARFKEEKKYRKFMKLLDFLNSRVPIKKINLLKAIIDNSLLKRPIKTNKLVGDSGKEKVYISRFEDIEYELFMKKLNQLKAKTNSYNKADTLIKAFIGYMIDNNIEFNIVVKDENGENKIVF